MFDRLSSYPIILHYWPVIITISSCYSTSHYGGPLPGLHDGHEVVGEDAGGGGRGEHLRGEGDVIQHLERHLLGLPVLEGVVVVDLAQGAPGHCAVSRLGGS